MGQAFEVCDLGRLAYGPALAVQDRKAEQRRRGELPDTLILVEHDPVYTLGRSAQERHVLTSPEELRRRGLEVVRTGRGGDVTYHGPGQLVGYPILDLAARGLGVLAYVEGLEEVLLRTLADFGVRGHRDPAHRGVWIGEEKIAAIGVRVSRGITTHGFALNVAVDLEAYRAIVPCGLADRGVTSLDRLRPAVALEAVKPRLVARFGEVLYGDGEGGA